MGLTDAVLPFSTHAAFHPMSPSPSRKGTDDRFPSPVPGFRPFSCSDRVQITLFLLLYPVFVCFPAQIGYRSPFSFSCTRFPSVFLLRSGTDHTFSTPVPGFRPFSCSDRVQITLFPLLYPVSVHFPAQIGYRSHFFYSCTLAVICGLCINLLDPAYATCYETTKILHSDRHTLRSHYRHIVPLCVRMDRQQHIPWIILSCQ